MPDILRRYTFSSPTEEISASIFNDAQIQHIKNMWLTYAQEKLTMSITPEDIEKYKYMQEYVRGAMEALSYLIEVSEAAVAAIVTSTDPQKG